MRPRAKYAVIHRHRSEYSVSTMCQFFGVSRSGYYDFVRRIGKPEKDAELAAAIRRQQEKSFNTYGYRRMCLALESKGIRDIEEIKERLLSFGKYAENAAPDVLITLIQTFVERIYITDENDERHCHIFIKGCSKEDYDDFFRATGYIENTQETGTVTSVLPVCDSDECCKHYVIFAIPLRMR